MASATSHRQLRVRTAVAVVVLPCVLLVAVITGWVRERQSLPGAGEQLRLAVIEAGGVLTCLQGVQDELYVPGIGRLETAAAVEAARARLSGCDVGSLRTALGRIHVPAEPAVDSGRMPIVRTDVVDAVAALRRLVLDADGTKKAMALDLTDQRQGQVMALGYRAAQAEYDQANTLLTEALSLLSK